jgi:K+-transporting ATPase ATPase C chain
LIGQEFRGADYFHGRPSCTGEFAYNPALSGASNLGPSNQKLLDATNGRVKTFKLNSMDKSVPVDLVTASASGLDPDISVASALIQVERVAKARGISVDELTKLVEQCTEARTFGILGQARVNVLKLNMVLDQFTRGRHDHGRDKARS